MAMGMGKTQAWEENGATFASQGSLSGLSKCCLVTASSHSSLGPQRDCGSLLGEGS